MGLGLVNDKNDVFKNFRSKFQLTLESGSAFVDGCTGVFSSSRNTQNPINRQVKLQTKCCCKNELKKTVIWSATADL